MNTIDLSPLFRSTIGFDRVSRLLDSALNGGDVPSYPPYNIEKVEDDKYRLVFAVAGFGEDDLTVTVKENTLLVAGKVENDDNAVRYLHRGIAGRAFERRFELADHIQVESGRLENGLLIIELKREVPEALKPRNIPISGSSAKVIEQKVAA